MTFTLNLFTATRDCTSNPEEIMSTETNSVMNGNFGQTNLIPDTSLPVNETEGDIESAILLTDKEKSILRQAILTVHASIRNRHKNSSESDQNSAGYSLQDWLGDVNCYGIKPEELEMF